jgi:hypothetical protein
LGKRTLTPCPGANSPLDLPDDLLKWLSRCEENAIYESLMTPEERARPGYRGRFKARVLRFLYGAQKDTDPRHPNEIRPRMRTKYPTIDPFLGALKARDPGHAARLLQCVEARS